jgi:uncharacterized protein (DUF427 family)
MQSNVIQQRVPVHGDGGHWIHVSESPRHVRVFFGGEIIADSKRVKLVREAEILPAYYFLRLAANGQVDGGRRGAVQARARSVQTR